MDTKQVVKKTLELAKNQLGSSQDVHVSTVTVSEVGIALILLDQELRNNVEEKRRLQSRISRMQDEIDHLSLESLRCQGRIDAGNIAINRLTGTNDYQLLYGNAAKVGR